jgi:hypothetical protein
MVRYNMVIKIVRPMTNSDASRNDEMMIATMTNEYTTRYDTNMTTQAQASMARSMTSIDLHEMIEGANNAML